MRQLQRRNKVSFRAAVIAFALTVETGKRERALREARHLALQHHLFASSRSDAALTLRPRAMRAILSIETLRSDRSTPLR
jgi:hypothetical protein